MRTIWSVGYRYSHISTYVLLIGYVCECVHEEVESLYGHKIDRQSVDDGDGEEEWRKCPWNLEEIENKFLRADYWPFR